MDANRGLFSADRCDPGDAAGGLFGGAYRCAGRILAFIEFADIRNGHAKYDSKFDRG